MDQGKVFGVDASTVLKNQYQADEQKWNRDAHKEIAVENLR